jgi:3-phenylpropionate/trans-cinnamate dioxygenase ferredoxin subunit
VSRLLATLRRADLPDGKPTFVIHPPRHIVVVRLGDEVFALENLCRHADAHLLLGAVRGCTIECRAHGYLFDLRTGALLHPADESLTQQVYEVRRDGPDTWTVWTDTPPEGVESEE